MARLIDAVLGHRDTWAKLMTAIARGHLPHALAFTGPAGIGKRLVARALAQTLVCEAEPDARPNGEPCGVCGGCRRIENEQSEALLEIGPEKNQIKLESAREILAFLNLRRVTRVRVVIVNDAQLMNAQTANACLKIIEEPPAATYFILITPELSQLLPTLRSRAQVLRFHPLTEDELALGVARGGEDLPKPEAWMLRAAHGSFERLANLTDEDVVAVREIALSYLRDALAGRRGGISTVLASVKDRERTLSTIQFLQNHLRDWSVGDLDLGSHPPRERVELWRRAHAMEVDFHAHVDRSLIFQNFFNRAQPSTPE